MGIKIVEDWLKDNEKKPLVKNDTLSENKKPKSIVKRKKTIKKNVEISTDISEKKTIARDIQPKLKECKWCGHLYSQKGKEQCCCVEHERNYEEYKYFNMIHGGKDSMILAKREVSDNMKQIAYISKKALEEGLSYGQYVAKHGI